MTDIAPGWYRDPADPTTQRYWDGEGWLGDPIAADATAPDGPPAIAPPAPPEPATPPMAAPAGLPHPAAGGPGAGGPGAGGAGGTGAGGPKAGGPAAGRPWPPTGQLTPPAWMTAYPGAPVRPHGLALASPGTRLAARLIDVLSVLVLCVIANAWFGYQFWVAMKPALTEATRRVLAGDTTTAPIPEPTQDVSTLLFMILFVILAVWFAYEVPATANSGQTLGKRIMQIKVMRLESDERLGFGRSWRRFSRLGVPTLLWPCCLVGLGLQTLDCLSVATDRPLHQALHDKSAATVVIQVPRAARRKDTGHDTPASPNAHVGGRDADSRKP